MTKVVEAIYENGVLRPVEALNLPEQQRVTLRVQPLVEDGGPPVAANGAWPEMEPTESARLAALDELFDEIDQANVQLRLRLPTRDERR